MEYLSKSDIVTAELRQRICEGELPAGTVLRQLDIAQQFGVSHTPVREALRRLESEGYIITQLHRGATVTSADPERTQEDLLIMANLESLAAALAAGRATDEDVAEIEELEQSLNRTDLPDGHLTELNRQFHFRIYQCARSPILLSLLNQLWRTATARLASTLDRDEMAAEHERIVAAIRARSPADAAERTREHIMTAAPKGTAPY